MYNVRKKNSNVDPMIGVTFYYEKKSRTRLFQDILAFS